jgi:lipopolysaccharide export LptBFGC system permease protein LptF
MTEIVQTIERITAESAALRGALIGTVIGFFVVGGFAFWVALNAGTSTIAAVGLALFAGFWGGPGFGGMLGATLAVTRNEEREREAPAA